MRHTYRMNAVITLLLTTLLLSACGGESEPMAPAELPDVAGSWDGLAVDTFDADQTVVVLLQQEGSTLTGTISSMIFRTMRIFPLTGTVDADGRVTATVLAADTGGCFDVTISLALSSRRRRLAGGYVIDRKADGCGRQTVGTPPSRSFSLQR